MLGLGFRVRAIILHPSVGDRVCLQTLLILTDFLLE
jgi:hypothetical protein